MILLDVDGVICDFVGAAISLHGLDPVKVLANYPLGEWDIAKVLGVSQTDFWKRIDAAGEDWWATLPEYPWADELISLVGANDDWVFATSPSRFHGSASGKVRWMQRKFGSHFRKYMLGEHKHLLAKPGAILIDDNQLTCEKFDRHEGSAILFPRPWNNSLQQSDWPVYCVDRALRSLKNYGKRNEDTAL